MSIPVTMKAVVLHDADDMRLESRPVPQPSPGEVLLKVNVAAICGTDVKVRAAHGRHTETGGVEGGAGG